MAQLKYPKAFLAMGNGDLIQVTNFSVQQTNGGKQKHTLRRPASGVSTGNPEHTVTFDSEIDENGPERNYWKDCKRGTIRQIRAKLPGGRTTLVVEGIFTQVNTDGPLDDATKVSCTFVGDMDEPEI
jgi:hypothetical protein